MEIAATDRNPNSSNVLDKYTRSARPKLEHDLL